jgi:tRNA(His) 5'-end guanylyltransferase
MKRFNAKCGYTHSDEITVLLEPAPPTTIIPNKNNNGQQQTIMRDNNNHIFNGRVQKLASLSAETVTARFNCEISKLCYRKGLDYSSDDLATYTTRSNITTTMEIS